MNRLRLLDITIHRSSQIITDQNHQNHPAARPRLAEAMQGWLRGGSRLWWYLGSLLPAVNIFNGFAAVMFSEAGPLKKIGKMDG